VLVGLGQQLDAVVLERGYKQMTTDPSRGIEFRRELQRLLANARVYNGPIDGTLSPAMKLALEKSCKRLDENSFPAPRALKTQTAAFCMSFRIVHWIGQRPDLIGGIADDQRHALLGMAWHNSQADQQQGVGEGDKAHGVRRHQIQS
jgi:hypothetical protein